jgi:DNA repair protein RadC
MKIVRSRLIAAPRSVPGINGLRVCDAGPATVPAQLANVLYPLISSSPVEVVIAIGLDSGHRPICAWQVSVGTLTEALVHPIDIFGPAIRLGTVAAIALGHNHPSGNLAPSEQDYALTQRIVDAGKLLGIKLIDHLIVNPEQDYKSIREVRPNLFN